MGCNKEYVIRDRSEDKNNDKCLVDDTNSLLNQIV